MITQMAPKLTERVIVQQTPIGFPSLDSTNQNDNKVIKKGTNPRLNVFRMAQIDWERIAKCLEETDNTKLD